MIRVGLLQPFPMKKFYPWNLWFLFKYVVILQVDVNTCLSSHPWFHQVVFIEIWFAQNTWLRVSTYYISGESWGLVTKLDTFHTDYVLSDFSGSEIQNWSSLQSKKFYYKGGLSNCSLPHPLMKTIVPSVEYSDTIVRYETCCARGW